MPHNKSYHVDEVISPKEFVLNGENIKYDEFDCFDSKFTKHNEILAEKFNITEAEAFIFGNLGKYWASNLMKGRKVYLDENSDMIYLKYSYLSKFLYSGYCIKNDKPYYKEQFDKIISSIRRADYKVLDLDTDIVYNLSDAEIRNLKNFLVIRKSHLPRHVKSIKLKNNITEPKNTVSSDGIKVLVSDLTTNIMPTQKCKDDICKEILFNIKNAKETIDMAIYGYSRVPEIEKALTDAQKRGVKIRLVYDSDKKGENIYPDTKILTEIIKNNKSDLKSEEVKSIMHNKFYIFDNKILITGSANLSHTDMSGFNSNSVIIINSSDIAKIFKQEFEQMYAGKFHNNKIAIQNKHFQINKTNLDIYFSPKDKAVINGIIPLINNSQRYIYIPTFLITNKDILNALINAKKRGVDIKIIVDALNASVHHSKHKELRDSGILVKTENYAGKMHSKSMIIDDMYTVIGSMNFSYSGENKNDENLIVIKNSEITGFYKKFFLYQWNKIDDKWLKYNARAEGKDSIGSCYDGLDNNYDGFTDLADPACKSH